MPYGVVIPAYNASATILDTLQSVLSQTVKAAEVVVVDDGSSDDTVAVIEASGLAGVRVLRQNNAGAGAATNLGIATITTPLIATLDADDIWLPEKIERQLAHMSSNPACAGVFTMWRTFRTGDDTFSGPALPGWSRTTMLLRRGVAETVGPVIDPTGGRGDMVDWIARAREAGFLLDMLDEVLALRRIRPGSLSYGRDPQRDRGYLEVVRRAMQRRSTKSS